MSFYIAFLVTCAMATVDYCQSQYTAAVTKKTNDRPTPDIPRMIFWSIGQWGAVTIAFAVAVKLSMWYLPFEAAGLAIGSYLGGKRLEQSVPPVG